jgi:hypothetical protein
MSAKHEVKRINTDLAIETTQDAVSRAATWKEEHMDTAIQTLRTEQPALFAAFIAIRDEIKDGKLNGTIEGMCREYEQSGEDEVVLQGVIEKAIMMGSFIAQYSDKEILALDEARPRPTT